MRKEEKRKFSKYRTLVYFNDSRTIVHYFRNGRMYKFMFLSSWKSSMDTDNKKLSYYKRPLFWIIHQQLFLATEKKAILKRFRVLSHFVNWQELELNLSLGEWFVFSRFVSAAIPLNSSLESFVMREIFSYFIYSQ